ncbi:unnamed protein product, partial [Rotaria sp. Silwood1]
MSSIHKKFTPTPSLKFEGDPAFDLMVLRDSTTIRREALQDHILSSSVEHLQILADICSSFQNQAITTYSQPLSMQSTAISTSENLDIKSLQNELIKQTQIIEQLRLEQKSLQSMLIKRERDLTRVSVDLQLF